MQHLELKGIVPKGYFSKGHKSAMTRKHRRKSSAAQDLATMIALRPKPEQMVAKGLVQRSAMEQYIQLDEQKIDHHQSMNRNHQQIKRKSQIFKQKQNQNQIHNHPQHQMMLISKKILSMPLPISIQ